MSADRGESLRSAPLVRADAIEILAREKFDVIVVGGGITGSYIALDASLRGYRVALLEKDDFGSGTSSKSSKMVHGGLRYIQQGNVSLVRHSLLERQRLRENAGFLVERLPFVFPILKTGGTVNRKISGGFGALLKTYDSLGGKREGIRHEKLTTDQVLRYCPNLHRDEILHGYLFYDARTDDARLTMTVARTAAACGATILNHAKVESIIRTDGRVTGVGVQLGDTTMTVESSAVVMATGVWLHTWTGASATVKTPDIRPAKGVHIVVPWHRVRNDTCVTIPLDEKRGAVAYRWGDFTVLGTTDEDYTGDLDSVACTREEMLLMVGALKRAFNEEISEADVTGTIAGCRPLIAGAGTTTRELSRSHEIRTDPDGLISVVGGKLTTGRHMAELTVDQLEQVIGKRNRCVTRNHYLVGGADYDAQSILATGGVAAHLGGRYGSESGQVSQIVQDRPESMAKIVEGLPYIEAEVVYATRYELALTVDDVLSRRTRARFLARDASAASAHRVAAIMGAELGWSDTAIQTAAQDYIEDVAREKALLAAP